MNLRNNDRLGFLRVAEHLLGFQHPLLHTHTHTHTHTHCITVQDDSITQTSKNLTPS